MILATDLDRTLIPNGNAKYDESMDLFKEIVKKEKIKLIYITGRSLKLTKSAIKKYSLPKPEILIADVGTRIYKGTKNGFKIDKSWGAEIKKEIPRWSASKIKRKIDGLKGLILQEKEKQSQHKVSYYVNLKNEKNVIEEVENILSPYENFVKIVYSHDFPKKRGLLDILPVIATKKGALDFIVKKRKIDKKKVIFAGDSGNDIPLLFSHYKVILVANATNLVKKELRKNRRKNIFIASAGKKLNGNYVSGIIQGLINFGFVRGDSYGI